MDRDKIQKKVDEISSKVEKNKTISYYFLTSIFVIGVLFFLSSNALFNKEISLISTEINQEIYLNSNGFSIKERRYNPENGLVQFTLNLKCNSSNNKLNFDFEVREKNNPTEIIPCEVVQVTYNDYIIVVQVKSKWEALSLTIKEKKDTESNTKFIKLYSDIRDIEIDKELKVKSANEYTLEVIDNEIEDIKSKMNEISSSINDKKVEIENLNTNIEMLKEEIKYQTESEIKVTESSISNSITTIANKENEIKRAEEKTIELEEKIKKLEEKKTGFQ